MPLSSSQAGDPLNRGWLALQATTSRVKLYQTPVGPNAFAPWAPDLICSTWKITRLGGAQREQGGQSFQF